MGRFQSELHIICEEARWSNLEDILRSLRSPLISGDEQKFNFNESGGRSTADRWALDYDDTSRDEKKQTVSKEARHNGHAVLEMNLTLREGPHQWTPLMIACVRAPSCVIASLVSCCPSSCSIPDRSGSLPLHFVSCWRRDEDDSEVSSVVSALLHACPETITMQNQWGQTPLHCAFDSKECPGHETVKELLGLSQNPNSAHADSTSKTSQNSRHEAWQKQMRPLVRKALSTPDAKSRLPLHIAAEKGVREEVLRVIISLYPEAATTPTEKGDLPIHLLHYWAEETAKSHSAGVLEGSVRAGRISRSAMNAVGLGSITALLEPVAGFWATKGTYTAIHNNMQAGLVGTILGTDVVGVKEDGQMKAISEKDEEETEPDVFSEIGDDGFIRAQSISSKASTSASNATSRKAAAAAAAVAAIAAAEAACRLPGSKGMNLPIHIACEHGVSHVILSALCEQYPEGVSTPRPVTGPQSNLLENVRVNGDTNKPFPNYEKKPDIYPIEIFESGRASIETATAVHMQRRHMSNPKNSPISNSNISTSSLNKSRLTSVLQSFVDRSDLLFAYHPEAIPSQLNAAVNIHCPVPNHVEIMMESVSSLGSATSARDSKVRQQKRKKVVKPYRKDADRLERLVKIIRTEALDVSVEFSPTARLVWTWMCRYTNPADVFDNYQGHIGRIITHLPQPALAKLSYVTQTLKKKRITNGISRAMYSSGSSSEDLEALHDSEDNPIIGQELRLFNGRTIQEEAQIRAAAATMEDLMNTNSWQFHLTKFLSDRDALNYSVLCRRTRAAGVRFLPEMKLKETGRSWNLTQIEADTNLGNNPKRGPKNSEFWQDIDNLLIVSKCTHYVYITYFLEVSASNDFNPSLKNQSSQTNFDSVENRRGGLLVVSTPIEDQIKDGKQHQTSKFRGIRLECREQKKIKHSKLNSSTCNEVRLSFKYDPRRKYSLFYYGPVTGGRVSVSSARIRQLLHASSDKGRSPLHVLLNSNTITHDIPLCNQVKILLDVKFGSTAPGDSVGEVPLHYALKCGVSIKMLKALIEANPSSLVETDREGRTPLHAAFLLSQDQPPSLNIIKALLSTPGENATKLKDAAVRLPLHIAAERGANESILRLLVDAYPDGCYRQNKDGDLPVHLLVRSGIATTETITLLLTPIMKNETICRIPGSRGVDYPLHMAAEYQCSYDVLSTLLLTFSEAAVKPRRRLNLDGTAGPPIHALDIFELWRCTVITQTRAKLLSKKKIDSRNEVQISLDSTDMQLSAKEAAEFDIAMADFDLRSDLLFVHNPTLTPHALTGLALPYRKDLKRIMRLQNLVRREAIQCAESKKVKRTQPLSRMALLAWSFFCTFTNPDDPLDHYADSVGEILKGLSTSVVQVLADAPTHNLDTALCVPVIECANPKCAELILNRIRFVGRYVLSDDAFPIHKSDSSLVVRAEDHGAVANYKSVLSLFQAEEMPDIDDLASIAAGSVANVAPDCPTSVFLKFAKCIGISEVDAHEEITKLVDSQNSSDNQHLTNIDFNQTPYINGNREGTQKQKDITIEAFRKFCTNHLIDNNGVRHVVIKFMLHRCQFEREISMRSKLELPTVEWPVAPILDNYNIDRIEEAKQNKHPNDVIENNLQGHLSGYIVNSKDELYLLDVQEKNTSIHNFSLYKYAVVMPGADKDLCDIFYHEDIGILQIREYMKQVGVILQCLHDKDVIHGDLKMANIVRFRHRLALIDLDSSCSSKIEPSSDPLVMGGSSRKFSSGILPPEMISRINLDTDVHLLVQYENYWSNISNDSKDLKLLTPDDIQTITTVIHSLLAKSEAVRNMGSSLTSLRFTMNEPLAGLEDPQKDWKDILSLALVTISFSDLPQCLSKCETLTQFSNVWKRLQTSNRLWEKVRPQISKNSKFAYVVKSFCDSDDSSDGRKYDSESDKGTLPYEFLTPSPKVDIWAFGVLLFSLCSRGSLFHTSYDGNLKDVTSYENLRNWTKEMAEKVIDKNIADPLAQDLLLQLLVPENERLENMTQVLQHPFFGPPSDLEAQRILERFEERQLIEEETVIINVMTNESKRKIELATEKFCKIVFEGDKIIVPTSFIVLPYELKLNNTNNCMEAPNDLTSVGVAVKIGKCLLHMNANTARLSFWLIMKKKLNGTDGREFKSKMKSWLKRARTEDTHVVARDIVSNINCSSQYMGICIEMLEKGDNISNARAFIRDPMNAARVSLQRHTNELIKLYSNELVYLVDELNGTPVISTEGKINGDNSVYPIRVDKKLNYLRHFFIPFMNITIMSQLAVNGLKSLCRILGIPVSYGIPDSWLDLNVGLVHTKENPSSIAEFAVLQDVLRKRDRQDSSKVSVGLNSGNSSVQTEFHSNSGNSDSKVTENSISSDSVQIEAGEEMNLLEVFFRQYDPMRIFCDMHRVSDGKENSPGVWTRKATVTKMQEEVELASMETRLRVLKRELLQKAKLKDEIKSLAEKVNSMKGLSNCSTPSDLDVTCDTKVTENTTIDDDITTSNHDITSKNKPPSNSIDIVMNPEDFEDPYYRRITNDPNMRKHFSTSSMSSDGKRKKVRNTQKMRNNTRNSKRKGIRFRPYFGAC